MYTYTFCLYGDFMDIKAHAKINLALDIVGRRDDGYHLVRMIMQSLELHDTVSIKKNPSGSEVNKITIHTDSDLVEDNEYNLGYKAARIMCDRFDIKDDIDINIVKRIPVAAGLAGGSSDAAAVLKGMNELFELGLSTEDLQDIGLKLGADVPYCIVGHTMLSEGIGEVLTPVPSKLGAAYILLAKPSRGVSTKEVYQKYDSSEHEIHPDVDAVKEAIESGNLPLLAENLGNVLEDVTIPMVSEIKEIKDKMLDLGAVGTLMSGSGPTVFGIFDDKDKIDKAVDVIKESFTDTTVISTTCI